jgi:hypothetical protein
MRVPEELFCIDLFRQKPDFTSLHLKYPVHVVPPLQSEFGSQTESKKSTLFICRIYSSHFTGSMGMYVDQLLDDVEYILAIL